MATQVATTTIRRWLSYAEAADHLGISERFLRRAVAEDAIPYVRFGARVKFDLAKLDQWAEKQRPKRSRGGV